MIWSLGVWAQYNQSAVANTVWEVKSDVMSGMVKQHTAFPKSSTIAFNQNGTWVGSNAVGGFKVGKWILAGKQLMTLTSDAGKLIATFSISKLSDTIMILKQHKTWSVRTIQLVPANREKILQTMPIMVNL